MVRVLIADQSSLFIKLLSEQLDKEFEVRSCESGYEALDLLVSFQPEIVVLDVTLADESGITVLHTIQAVEYSPSIIALSYMTNERALMHLNRYNITCVVSKPCTVELVVDQVRNIAFRMCHPLEAERPLENEIDALLMTLGFRIGMKRYKCVAYAIMVRYNNPDCAMKELYIDVAKKCGGTPQSVEKAIRDSINRAYDRGNHNTWAYYFKVPKENGKPCNGNSEFLGCMVACLRKNRHNRRYAVVN